MIGAIAGDIIGSVYEWNNIKTKQFDLFSPDCCFTDDTVLTVALAESLLTGTDYVPLMKAYYQRYPNAGYGDSHLATEPVTCSRCGHRATPRKHNRFKSRIVEC